MLNSDLAHGPIEPPAQERNLLVELAFRFQLHEQLGSEDVIALLEALSGPLQPALDFSAIEILERLIAIRLPQSFAEFARIREAAPRLLGHGLIHYLAEGVVGVVVDLG